MQSTLPRTPITPALLVGGGCLAIPGGTAIDAEISAAGAVIHDSRGYQTILQVDNTADTAKSVTVRASAHSSVSVEGDLTLTVGAGETSFLGPFDSAPFAQANGDLYIDFEEGFRGILRACQAPRV